MLDAIKHGPSRLEQCPMRQLSNPSKWTLQGHSKAGEKTGFLLYPHKFALDLGLNTYKSPTCAFISHSHTDHSIALMDTFRRRDTPIKGQEHLKGRPVYFPESAHQVLRNARLAYHSLGNEIPLVDTCDNIFYQTGVHPFSVKEFDKFKIPGHEIEVEVLPAYHKDFKNNIGAISLGYGFTTLKKKLKPEYLEMSKNKETKQQFIDLVKANHDVYNLQQTPELMFYSDSTIDNLLKHDEWKKYPVVIVECTGFDEVYSPEVTYNNRHTHWEHLFPVMLQHPDIEWILIHTSMGINNKQIDTYQHKMEENNIKGYIWKVGHLYLEDTKS